MAYRISSIFMTVTSFILSHAVDWLKSNCNMYDNFIAAGRYRSLWPEVTTFLSQEGDNSLSEVATFPCLTLKLIVKIHNWSLTKTYGILQPEAVTVRCGLRSQHS